MAAHAAASTGADLGVAMLRSDGVQRSIISPGQAFTVSIGVHNLRGAAAASNAVLTLVVPPGLTVREARPAPGRTQRSDVNTTLTWTIGVVPVGAPPQVTEVDLLPANDLQKNAQLDLAASVSSDNDSDARNNSFILRLEAMPAQPDLAVDSNLASVPLTVEQPVKFSMSVSNWGTVPAPGSTLSVTLPAGVALRSSEPAGTATGDTLSWQLGDIAPGDTRIVAIVVDVDARLGAPGADGTSAQPPPVAFKFDATTPAEDADPQDNYLEVLKSVQLVGADAKIWLGLDGAAEPGELPIGKDVTFRLLYGNFGSAIAKDAGVSLRLWDGLRFMSASVPPTRAGANDTPSGSVVNWRVGDLVAGAQGAIDCVVHVESVPGDGALVAASIAIPGIDVNPVNNQAYLWNFASSSLRNKAAAPEHSSRWSRALLFGAPLLLAALLVATLAGPRVRRRT